MTVVSTKDFRTRQPHYLRMARNGEHVVLRSRGGLYHLTFEAKAEEPKEAGEPKRDVTAEICQAMKDWRDELNGIDTGKFRPAEELIDELRNL